MIEFLVMRIKNGALDYAYAISKRPDLKKLIDEELARQGEEKYIIK